MNIFNIDPHWNTVHRNYIGEASHQLSFVHMPIVAAQVSESATNLRRFAVTVKAPGIEGSRGVVLTLHDEILDESTTLAEAKQRAEALCRFFYGEECFSVKVP